MGHGSPTIQLPALRWLTQWLCMVPREQTEMDTTSSILGSKVAQGHYCHILFIKERPRAAQVQGEGKQNLPFNGKGWKVQEGVRNCGRFRKPSVTGEEKCESERKQKEGVDSRESMEESEGLNS